MAWLLHERHECSAARSATNGRGVPLTGRAAPLFAVRLRLGTKANDSRHFRANRLTAVMSGATLESREAFGEYDDAPCMGLVNRHRAFWLCVCATAAGAGQ